MTRQAALLLLTFVAVGGLVVLVARCKVHSFIALILASLFVGVTSGMSLPAVVDSFQEGVGGVLKSIAVVIGLGTVLGKLLAESGGAERIAQALIDALGEKRLHWTMMLAGFIVGIPVFFSVGLVLLIPVVFTLARRTNASLLQLGLPLVAGLSTVHGLVPPHPGPMVAIEVLHANVGKTILYSLLIGFPTAVVVGPWLGRWLAGRETVVATGGIGAQLAQAPKHQNPPGVALAIFTILLPVMLMVLSSAADITLPKTNALRQVADFAGSPVVALLTATLFAMWSFGFARGFDRSQLLKFSEDCLAPVATMLLVIGAGGGFNRVLVNSGVGDAIATVGKSLPVSPILLGWLIASLIRVAVGSATVAITTAAGIMAPIVAATPGVNVELLVIALGAGSLILSHVNDGGFWFVKEYLNLSVPQTLRTWTVIETGIAVVALVLVLVLDMVLKLAR
jgi:GntP family gluconate:H+ symporter